METSLKPMPMFTYKRSRDLPSVRMVATALGALPAGSFAPPLQPGGPAPPIPTMLTGTGTASVW